MPYFQLDWHVDRSSYPEWGSAPRGPVLAYDMAHAGELLDSVIGPDIETGKPRVYHILRCELCIATHALPLPSPEALSRYYTTQFYQQDKPDYTERYQRDRTWWETCVHEPILRQCDMLEPKKHGKKFLDIGAGPGLALDVAQRLGYVTYALEPNRLLCEQLIERNHYAIAGTLEEAQRTAILNEDLHGDGPYDVLYLYETLEHHPCPEDFLLRCYDLLAPGGVLVVVVPNDYNPLQLAACTVLDLPRYWLAPPQHLFYFTPKTLQLLIRRCGFTLRDIRGTAPLEMAILAGENYIGHDDIGRQVHTARMAKELCAVAQGRWESLASQYRAQLADARWGREIVCLAQKII